MSPPRILAWVPGLFLAFASAGCSKTDPGSARTAEPVGESREALAVGNAIDIGVPAKLDGEKAIDPKVACRDDGRCLAVWFQAHGSYNYLVGRRFDASGPIDTELIAFGAYTQTPILALAARPSGDFLVAWSHPSVGVGLHAAFVDAATAAVTELSLGLPVSATLGDVVSTGSGYVLVYHYSDTRAVRITNGVADVPGISVGPSTVSRVVVGPDQLAVAFAAQGLVRVSLSSGSVLDASLIDYSKYAPADLPALAFDGSNYVALWPYSGKVYTARIRASDGALLDPPDEFNQLPGAHVIATDSAIELGLTWDPVRPDAYYDGKNVLGLWVRGPWYTHELVGARIGAGGTRLSGSPDTQYEFSLASLQAAGVLGGHVSLAPTSGALVAAWSEMTPNCTDPLANCGYAQGGVALLRSTQPAGSVPSGSSLPSPSFLGSTHDISAVASDGHDFLVAYRDPSRKLIQARLFDAASGSALGAPFTVGPWQGRVALPDDHLDVAWSGSFYVVVWDNTYRLISCAGELLAGPTAYYDAATHPSVACNDDKCLIVYQNFDTSELIEAQRVDAHSGALVDTSPLLIGGAELSVGHPAVASDSKPSASQRTFLVTWSVGSTAGESPSRVNARRVRSSLGTLLAPVTLAEPSYAGDVMVASDGDQFYVAYDQGNELWGTRVDAITGAAPAGVTPIKLAAQTGLESIRVGFDGAAFVATISSQVYDDPDAPSFGIHGLRISTAGALLDGTPFLIREQDTNFLSLGTTAFGRSLVGFDDWDTPSFATLIRGKTIDDDLGSGTAPPAQCVTGSGGTGGGSGGVGGSAGGGFGGSGGSTGGSGGSIGGSGGSTGGSGGSGGSGSTGGSGGSGGSGGNGGSGGGGAGGSVGVGGSAGLDVGGGAGDSAGGASDAGGVSGGGGFSGSAGDVARAGKSGVGGSARGAAGEAGDAGEATNAGAISTAGKSGGRGSGGASGAQGGVPGQGGSAGDETGDGVSGGGASAAGEGSTSAHAGEAGAVATGPREPSARAQNPSAPSGCNCRSAPPPAGDDSPALGLAMFGAVLLRRSRRVKEDVPPIAADDEI